MSDLVQSYLAAYIRQGVTLGAGLLIKHGIDASQANGLAALVNPQAVAGFIFFAASLAWSLLHKKSVNTQLIQAGVIPIPPTKPSTP